MKYTGITTLYSSLIEEYLISPDKFVYPFVVKEKTKERQIITYNAGENFGVPFRAFHEKLALTFENNFCDRNAHSFAYHKKVRTLDALQDHLKSTYFIKLDIHHFFDSITESTFFEVYGERFNSSWKKLISSCFYKGSLSIGYVTSPVISDYFMSKFDDKIALAISKNKKLHYSRYCDDILISSEEDNDTSLEELYSLIKEELASLHLELNDKKIYKTKLDYDSHNSISFLGLAISRLNEDVNKITISKRYILFLLQLIKKNNCYQDSCKGLLDEINSRVGYLYYNSIYSYERFQRKHENIYGVRYNFIPKKPVDRSAGDFAKEIPDWDSYLAKFKLKLHGKSVDSSTGAITANDSVILEKYIGKETEVEIPKFVDAIGDSAFIGSNVCKISFNDRLKSIGNRAFAASKIEEIVLPAKLRSLGQEAFANTPNLKSITIPSKVKRIQTGAFRESAIENIVLPEGLEQIEANAFDSSNLKTIVIPDTVKTIGNAAFSNCYYLESVKLPNGILSLEPSTFASCYSLKSIDFPESLLSINQDCFSNCVSLKELFIPKTIVNISWNAFSNCHKLTKIVVDKDNLVFDSREDCNSIIESATNKLIIRTENSPVPESIEYLGAGLFESSRIKEITLPKNLKRIGVNCFANCKLLKKVVVPSDLEIIGSNAFGGCISLESINLPDTLTEIGSNAFYECYNLKDIQIPDSVKTIGNSAFKFVSLVDFKIPSKLENLGTKAFSKCYGIKNIYIPSTLKTIGAHAFSGCSKNVESIVVDLLNPVFTSRKNKNVIIDVKTNTILLGCKNSIIDDDIQNIGDYAFEGCSQINNIKFPSKLEKIGKYAFAGCKGLEKIEFSKVYSIGDFAFSNCSGVKTLFLPDSVDTLGNSCFENCENLLEINIPNSVVHFGKTTFRGCKNVKSINLPSSYVDPFDRTLFTGCDNVEKISVSSENSVYTVNSNCLIDFNNKKLVYGCGNAIIPEFVETIGDGAFSHCKTIKQITIPGSVSHIGKEAFLNSSLTELAFDNNPDFDNLFNYTTVIERRAFAKCVDLGKIKFASQRCYDIGQSAFMSCLSLEELVLPQDITLNDECFMDCRMLKHLVLANSIYRIGGRAFAYTALESLDLSNVRYIGDGAFMNCENLKTVKFYDLIKRQPHLTNLGYGQIWTTAFKNCSMLEKVDLSYIDHIGPEAFCNCDKLSEVILCKEVLDEKPILVSIGNSAFENCSSLHHIDFNNTSSIGSRCFKDTPLDEVKFNKFTSSIGEHAFENNDNITSIEITENISKIGYAPFYGCKNLTIVTCDSANKCFIDKDNAIYLTNDSYSNDLIFATNGTKTIAEIARHISDEAFAGLNISQINIPDCYHSIGSRCFADCVTLSEVVLPFSLAGIKRSLFKGCTNLKHIDIPGGVRYIESDSFKGCPLESIYIPGYVSRIETGAFETSDNLKEIVVDEQNASYKSINNNLLVSANNKVILACKDSIIPEGTLSIGSNAFANLSITSLTLPQSLLYLETNCFYKSKIESIKIGKKLIKKEAFGYIFNECNNLHNIEVDKENPFLETINNNIMSKSSRTLLLTNNEAKIIEEANCVGSACFGAVDSIKNLFIPEFIYDFDKDLIANLNVEKIVVDSNNPIFDSRNDSNSINLTRENKLLIACKNTVIDESIVCIDKRAFEYVKDIKHIFIPKNVVSINASTFNSLTELEHIEVDKNNKIYSSMDRFDLLAVKNANIVLYHLPTAKIPSKMLVMREDTKYVKYNSGYNSTPASTTNYDEDDDLLPF